MSNEIENSVLGNLESVELDGFGSVERDAIGEIENITMGSAATAVSNLLNAKVWITTPRVKLIKASDLQYPSLEPSVHVKIEYILGIKGSSILVLKQSDVQLILAQLMGQPLEVTDDFEFDEMNISAVCEVMNQMMGASATALADLLGMPVDISTPVASVKEADTSNYFPAEDPDDYVVAISFSLTIDGVIQSEFISILSIELAKSMAGMMLQGFTSDDTAAPPAPEPAAPASSGGTMSQAEIEALMNGGGAAPAPQPGMAPAPQQQPYPGQQPGMDPYAQQPYPPQAMPPYGYPPQGYLAPGAMPMGQPQAMPPYGYPPQTAAPMPYGNMGVNVQPVQLQQFDTSHMSVDLNGEQQDNLKLLMNVPLDVTVEIGSAKRRVKEILDFTQGTIIELERQAGAPVDVIVNGHLIARGDVVVIEDNFAVRITEIIKSKFLDSLSSKE